MPTSVKFLDAKNKNLQGKEKNMRFSKTLLLAMGLTTISFAADTKQTICVLILLVKMAMSMHS